MKFLTRSILKNHDKKFSLSYQKLHFPHNVSCRVLVQFSEPLRVMQEVKQVCDWAILQKLRQKSKSRNFFKRRTSDSKIFLVYLAISSQFFRETSQNTSNLKSRNFLSFWPQVSCSKKRNKFSFCVSPTTMCFILYGFIANFIVIPLASAELH